MLRIFRVLLLPVALITSSPLVMADPSVQIPRGLHGEYITKGAINGRHVNFVVNRQAENVTLSMQEAKRLGLNYLKGTPSKITTANRVMDSFTLYVDKVSVGNIVVPRVKVSVVVGDVPKKVLLGNSFLSRISVAVNRGVLVFNRK